MRIFISHSHNDHLLAARLDELLTDASGFDIKRSSDKSEIKSGENWRDWIDENILECEAAVILLTPASLRGQWVLWEAGAVAGVQNERLRNERPDQSDASDVADTSSRVRRRVRVLRFNLDDTALGPFGSLQTKNGLDEAEMRSFVMDMLKDFRHDVADKTYDRTLLQLNDTVRAFVEGARVDLRHTPIVRDEGVLREWLDRLDEARRDGDDEWIVAAKRWINVAFLGIGKANAHEDGVAVDFRIHLRLADAHARLGQPHGTIEQLDLAKQLSPNDLVVLRKLGRARRDARDMEGLRRIMDEMAELDAAIFTEDREGITLRCGYFAGLGDWAEVDRLLAAANPGLVRKDAYLLNWRAIARMKVWGADEARPDFGALNDLLVGATDFWGRANRLNALLAVGTVDDVKRELAELELPTVRRSDASTFESATRFYGDIARAFDRDFDWRELAGLAV